MKKRSIRERKEEFRKAYHKELVKQGIADNAEKKKTTKKTTKKKEVEE